MNKMIFSSFDKKISLRFKELFRKRNYTCNGNIKIQEFRAVLEGVRPDGTIVVLVYVPETKFSVKTAERCLSSWEKTPVKHLIIVYRDQITCFARRLLHACTLMELESFAAKELETPIINHRLQPKSFNVVHPSALGKVKPSMLPKMHESDPIAKYFHFVKGDVVEIERKNGIIVYREVIEDS